MISLVMSGMCENCPVFDPDYEYHEVYTEDGKIRKVNITCRHAEACEHMLRKLKEEK